MPYSGRPLLPQPLRPVHSLTSGEGMHDCIEGFSKLNLQRYWSMVDTPQTIKSLSVCLLQHAGVMYGSSTKSV